MQTNHLYDYKSFIIADWSFDYDVKAQQSDLWKHLNQAGYVRITVNYSIDMKINKTSEPTITLTPSENPVIISSDTRVWFPLPYVDNLYFTNNSWQNITVGVYLWLPENALTS